MGKWAAALAAHLADEKSLTPPMGALPELTKAPSGSFVSDPVRGCSNFAVPIGSAANDLPQAGGRPYRLAQAEADAAHAEPWNDAAIGRFVARVGLFMRRGIGATDADDIAERLHLRDVQVDDRRLCVECIHLAGRAGAWRCSNHRAAGVGRDLPAVLTTTMQRCPGFVEVTP